MSTVLIGSKTLVSGLAVVTFSLLGRPASRGDWRGVCGGHAKCWGGAVIGAVDFLFRVRSMFLLNDRLLSKSD